jgi:leucyl-tRNA synthetase
MLVGAYKGKKTEEVKKLIQQDLIDAKQAAKYMEPEKLVMSRSGDECVVALTDQYFILYNNEDWKAKTRIAVDQMETYGDEVRRSLLSTIDWLHEYACSRLFGLGNLLR